MLRRMGDGSRDQSADWLAMTAKGRGRTPPLRTIECVQTDADGHQRRGGRVGQAVDQCAGKGHGIRPFPVIRSCTTALPISSPAVAGTQATLAGTERRPGGGASSCCVSWGCSGLNTTRRW